MSFATLFGKKKENKKQEPQTNLEQAKLNLDQKLQKLELRLQNLEVRQKNLQSEAKEKLKAGDKAGAKRLLAKRKKLI